MSEFPTESSPAGIVLALVVVVAPMLALFLSALLRPLLVAAMVAVFVSGSVIAAGVVFSLRVAPGSGTGLGAAAFGGWAGFLSLLMITVVTLGRAFLLRATAAKQPAPPEA